MPCEATFRTSIRTSTSTLNRTYDLLESICRLSAVMHSCSIEFVSPCRISTLDRDRRGSLWSPQLQATVRARNVIVHSNTLLSLDFTSAASSASSCETRECPCSPFSECAQPWRYAHYVQKNQTLWEITRCMPLTGECYPMTYIDVRGGPTELLNSVPGISHHPSVRARTAPWYAICTRW